jgi:hypothetical protein
MTYDANFAQADLGFDDKLQGGDRVDPRRVEREGRRPPAARVGERDRLEHLRHRRGTVADPDGGTLSFQVDQGPRYRYTYGAGAMYGARAGSKLPPTSAPTATAAGTRRWCRSSVSEAVRYHSI